MPKPIAVARGTCFAFPDVLNTPTPGGPVPMPYPNIAPLADAEDTASSVTAGGVAVILQGSSIPRSSGGEAGTASPVRNGACRFTSASSTVFAHGQAVVRQFDSTSQNGGNAAGTVISGVPTVLVGG